MNQLVEMMRTEQSEPPSRFPSCEALSLGSGLLWFLAPDVRPKCGFRGLFPSAGRRAAARRCEQKTKSIDRAGLECGIDRYGVYRASPRAAAVFQCV